MPDDPLRLPAQGRPKEEVLQSMRAAREHDVRWRAGRAFSLVYDAGREVEEVLEQAYGLFFSENGLNPTAFPSLRRFESEVVGMCARLLGGDEHTVGNMTGGGTESLLLAVKTARDWARARRPQGGPPEVILPVSAHPAFDKAAHYFGVRLVRTPLDGSYRADVSAMRAALTPDTALLVGSAPSYPHGAVDPIREIAALAQAHGALCHVDACVGGMLLPFARRLGRPAPDFDLSVPGVTSISADLHKYGYAAKGASVLLYREAALRRRQLFAAMDWPGGIYASPTIAGTRPGGAIAAAWAVMQFLGEAGYLRLARKVLETSDKLHAGVNAIPGLRVLVPPDMSIMALAGDGLDIYQVGDEMTARGWHLDRQQHPPSLHLTVHPGHAAAADDFLRDLAASARAARAGQWRRLGNQALLGAARLLLAAAVLALPIWMWAARRFSKRSAYVAAMLLWAGVQVAIASAQPGQMDRVLLLAVLAGVSVSSAHVLPDAIFPDVLEWDKLRTGRQRAGLYYGLKNFVRKLTGALAIFMALQALGWFGYQSPPDGATVFAQPESALAAIRFMTGAMGAVLVLSAATVAWFYPLTRERHARIRRLLAGRRARSA